MGQKPDNLLKDGKRLDGRDFDEVRELEAKASVLDNATGSGYFRMGETEVIAAVYGPRELHPKHLQNPRKGVLRCTYNLSSFSTEDRVKPGPSRRGKEIGMVIRKALSSVIFLEEFPKAAIDVFMEVITADAGTRCVALNAGVIALADAGIPMKGLISSCAAGKIEGTPVCDLDGPEDKHGDVDLPIAMNPETDEITLLQMDGDTDFEEFGEILDLAKKGCKQVYEKQKEALKDTF